MTPDDARLSERIRVLVEAIRNLTTSPAGTAICVCHGRNLVKAGVERACVYCEARALLVSE